ncbi:cation:proton antiporter [Synechococcus sp. PCC 7336]|uniref:cation:proton antiporter n=1 Tax=Synechococcus sp. PCC 7336 TaxID=195250 RepID=UPI000347FD39|nr:cation:proton antiporter [Synechococcus sp. PCC 7336]
MFAIAPCTAWLLPPVPFFAAEATELLDPSLVNRPIVQMVLLSLFFIYLAAKTGGEITNRLGLTSILGELVGGAVVGISLLNLVVLPGPGIEASDSLLLSFIQLFHSGLGEAELEGIFAAQGEILANLSQLGVILLLFQVGLESNLRELVRVAPQAAVVVLVGITGPLFFGLLGLLFLFGAEMPGALFAAAAPTAISIGISASILNDLDMLKSPEGQLIVGAAVLDDITGILILTVIIGISSGTGVSLVGLATLIVSAAVFLVGSTVLSRLIGSMFVDLLKPMQVRGGLLMLSLAFCFGLGFLADTIRLEALMGAFAAGIILSQTEVRSNLEHQLEPVAQLLVPIFFVVTGARTDLRVLNPFAPGGWVVILMGLFLAATVAIGRISGAYAVPTKQKLNRLAVGVGMLPLGEVALVIAGVGVSSGQMSSELSAAVVMAILVTVILTPICLRAALGRDSKAAAD